MHKSNVKSNCKGKLVFAMYSENPDNIPCMSHRFETTFKDKALLCELLQEYINNQKK